MQWRSGRTCGVVLLLAVAAGCLAPADEETTYDYAEEPRLSEALPVMEKLVFEASDADATVVDELLDRAPTTNESFTVDEAMGVLRLAIDVRPALADQAGPDDEVVVRVVDPAGTAVVTTPAADGPRKFVEVVEEPAAGTWTLEVIPRGSWAVGAVVVAEPLEYTPGIRMTVATPGAEGIEHRFHPDRINAAADAPTRITLYDYDPHAGVENLQHNIVIPDLGLKTEGRTTWGEVRVLDFTAPAGTYDYYCEFHEDALRGTLVVR